MSIPTFPDWADLDISMRGDLHPDLSMLKDGISEFTFAGLYLFRRQYNYRLSQLPDGHIVISGKSDQKRFFMLPCGLPEDDQLLQKLFSVHDYLKNLPEQYAEKERIRLEQMGFCVCEDRDNFDYLYLRKNLAVLAGRKYHKKRNLVNGFINSYSYEERWISSENMSDAREVLETWRSEREEAQDYEAAAEALEMMETLELSGCITYVDGKPAAYSLGEALAKGRAFAVHFEKANGNYKGIYQFINQSFASMLPRHYHYVNREQDLGDPGLRQAKMSYRPDAFVKKFKVLRDETGWCDDNNNNT
jgi:uncharacterized protein